MGNKRAIILMAYGSPERPSDIEEYFTNIRGGRKPNPEEVENLKQRYRKIGGKSPLNTITTSVAEKLEKRLGDVKVYAAMKHWHPFIAEVFEEIVSAGVRDLVAVALAPHYSKLSIGNYQDSVRKANIEHGETVTVKYVNEWHNDPVLLEKWANRIATALGENFSSPKEEIFILFTAHSLPERILTWGDPYKSQLLETAKNLAGMLSLEEKRYGFAFQSAGHTSEPWLGPDILEKISELKVAGWMNILIAPIGFVSDHLEILFDIDVEAKELARKLGIRVERTESFNDSDDFIDVLVSVVKSQGIPSISQSNKS